nr:MAG TPA: hypothetical protein [Caudoviricetes sp.]
MKFRAKIRVNFMIDNLSSCFNTDIPRSVTIRIYGYFCYFNNIFLVWSYISDFCCKCYHSAILWNDFWIIISEILNFSY